MNKIYNNSIEFTDTRDLKTKHMDLSITQDKVVQPTLFFEKTTALSILATELATVGNKHKYQRLCPYKFVEKDSIIYIQFAEKKPNGTSYQIKEKKLLKFSNKNNVKVYECFLYDILDYLVSIDYLTKIGDGYFRKNLNVKFSTYKKFPIVDDDYLQQNGFIFV